MGVLNKRRSVEWLLQRGVLISPEIVDRLDDELIERLRPIFKNNGAKNEPLLLNNATLRQVLEPANSAAGVSESVVTKAFPQYNIEIIESYLHPSTERSVEDFVMFFNARYRVLSSILLNRAELTNNVSIARLKNKTDRESISIIGLVTEIAFTKNNNLMLTLEDPTGSIRVIFTKKKRELFNQAMTVTLDEVIGVVGASGKNVLFGTSIVWPGVPMKELKKSNAHEYAIVISDLHIGSKNFKKKEFVRFLNWIQGKVGTETQKMVAERTRYIFLVGDLVDGVGVYPEQYNELEIKDIYEQYKLCAEYLSRIPNDKAIIICPGNHDALRLAEPQPPIGPELAPELCSLPNAIMVSNPALVNIGKTKDFSGFDVLLYHGYGFDYYVANIEAIRHAGGYNNPEVIMKYLLQRRHLSPTHGSTLYIPERTKDPLVIERVPDFFLTGHIHKSSISNFRNVTLVSGSCWQAKTAFQEKVGHEPEPCRVPMIELHTRKMRVLKFGG